MTFVKIHYDGWVALPASLRREFGVGVGDALEAVSSKEGILLRPLDNVVKAGPETSAPAAVEEHIEPEQAATADAPEPSPAAAKRTPKKPRSKATLPSDLAGRGRRRKAGEGQNTAQ